MGLSHERLIWRIEALVDALTYAAVLTAVALVGSLVLGLATGGGIVGAKILLFVVGWVLLGYSTFLLWPTKPPSDEEESDELGPSLPAEEASRFQGIARTLPPARWIQLPPPEHRVPLSGQLFVASISILVTSFVMETVFNVT